MEKINLNNVPKQFVDKHIFGFGKDHFVVGLICGQNMATYAFGRTNGKEFLQNLTKAVEKSEEMFGPIEVNSGIQSPVDFSNHEPKSGENISGK